jgi:sugar phosphate isomerase/epimerase
MTFDRRTFCATLFAPLLAPAGERKMKIHLTPGSLGVKADQMETIDLAARHGFEAAEPYAEYLAGISDSESAKVVESLRSKGLVWGCANLPVEFRQDDARFQRDIEKLPAISKALKRAGVTRVGTWLSPSHNTLPYVANFKQHAVRLRRCAEILEANGQRFGMEYVGPKTLWASGKYPFIHTMPEMKELIAEINRPNVGLVLDSWHWYTSGETEAELLTLRNQDVISVDLNDAPAGVPVDQQRDSVRELPCATGIIDVGTFLNALNKIGYDGPVRPEPFNATVRSLSKDEAVEVAGAATRKAFALIRG